MPNVRPVSDLKNYREVLQDVSVDKPVFLTCNGKKRYAVVNIDEYEKMRAGLKLMLELVRGESAGRQSGWHTLEVVLSEFPECAQSKANPSAPAK